MAEDCVGNTVSTSSSSPLNWWDVHASSLSSWSNANNSWSNQPNPNSSSSCEDEISVSTSFTIASNLSNLTVEPSCRLVEPSFSSKELMGEQASADNQLWNHLLLGVGGNEELHNNQVVGENFLDSLSSKSLTNSMFEPTCDYLKKLNTSWEYNNSTSSNSFQNHLNGFSEAMIENERLKKLSNLVNTWSIAPPAPEANSQIEPHTTSFDNYSQSNPRNSRIFPGYGHDMKVRQEHHANPVNGVLSGRSYNSMGHQQGFQSPLMGDNDKLFNGMPAIISLNNRVGRPLIGNHGHKPSMNSINISKLKKQDLQTSSPTRTNSEREQGRTGESKRKESEDSSEAILKKPKEDTSTASPTKVQAPKVKLGDKITTLQQIVSPFGKTDTASVLFETINYIKFLQEQVQVAIKTDQFQDPWGSLDRKDKGDAMLDLRSRGLCLVPISCTPQVYRDNSGPDYWRPAYRGCLYR
ncbi:hypothetical protein L6164_001276 [Bauhinia variegata]|uniref:Uncharacterized protein n=1 Tax=Bauhinia variegata TaxID=167791 RepID=A0ACB9QFP0_BAUVA|nr:hypothetical protein L6164_001276 [Bauhinia variegata]